MGLRLAVAFFLIGVLSSSTAFAESKATKIIRGGEKIMRGRSTQALIVMTIKRPTYTRILKLRSWTKGREKALVEILLPTREEGISSLRVAQKMWNYLPRIDQTVRVPTSMMLQSWMGSDFTNDDLMKANFLSKDYYHHVVDEQQIGKYDTILIECLPKRGVATVWEKIHHWARKKDNLPVQQKYFDDDGQWVRTIRYSRFRKMDDRVVPTRLHVEVADPPGYSTTIAYHKVLYDRRLGNQIFNKANLRKNSQRGKVLTAGWLLAPLGR